MRNSDPNQQARKHLQKLDAARAQVRKLEQELQPLQRQVFANHGGLYGAGEPALRRILHV